MSKKGFVIWFTGFSQSGKTTNADAVYKELQKRGVTAQRLDGDVIRNHTTTNLGFSPKDRNKNIEIACSLAKEISEKGTVVVASFITPYKEQREMLKREIENFVEVFCDCPLESCEKRDTKGLYEKARSGKINNFTGISDRYDAPENPEVKIDTKNKKVEECASEILDYLERSNFIE